MLRLDWSKRVHVQQQRVGDSARWEQTSCGVQLDGNRPSHRCGFGLLAVWEWVRNFSGAVRCPHRILQTREHPLANRWGDHTISEAAGLNACASPICYELELQVSKDGWG